MDELLLHALRMHRSTLGLDEEALHRIAASAQLCDFSAGDHLHRAGDPVFGLALIVNGRIALTMQAADRREQTKQA